jgi:dephospho-CoA kinase
LTSNVEVKSSARFVGLVGMPNAGKDICARFLEEKFNYLSIRMSSIVVEEARKRAGKEADRHQLQEIGAELRRQYGNGVIARRIVDDWVPWLITNVERAIENTSSILDLKKLHFVFNGVRSSGEVEVFRKEYGDSFLLIAVCSSFETRYKRAMIRKRLGFDNFDREHFRKLDNAELELGLGDAIGLADYYVINEGTTEEMLEQVRKIVAPNLQ